MSRCWKPEVALGRALPRLRGVEYSLEELLIGLHWFGGVHGFPELVAVAALLPLRADSVVQDQSSRIRSKTGRLFLLKCHTHY